METFDMRINDKLNANPVSFSIMLTLLGLEYNHVFFYLKFKAEFH